MRNDQENNGINNEFDDMGESFIREITQLNKSSVSSDNSHNERNSPQIGDELRQYKPIAPDGAYSLKKLLPLIILILILSVVYSAYKKATFIYKEFKKDFVNTIQPMAEQLEKNQKSEEIIDIYQPSGDKIDTTETSIIPFTRQLTDFELSSMESTGTTSEITSGPLKGMKLLSMSDNLGKTEIVHDGNDIYRFRFFPTDFDSISEDIRYSMSETAYKNMVKQVFGEAYYSENQNLIDGKARGFATTCVRLQSSVNPSYSLFNSYLFGCWNSGFDVISNTVYFAETGVMLKN